MEATPEATVTAPPFTRALDTIRKLRAQLAAQSGKGPTAVVGVGLRFPGGIADLDSYWDAVSHGRDLVRPLPDSRKGPFAAEWERLPHAGGFLDEVMDFDAEFFSVSAAEARALDPQQRLLLEVAWEALEDSALPPDRIDADRSGLFLGITGQDYWDWHTGELDVNWGEGNGHCFAVGRLAYALNLAGPAIAVDTACSSSLVSVHLARQALGRRECDVALAGGVNLALAPRATQLHHLAGMLSPDGRCKAFDARANGLSRGEGCGIVVLKRLEDALRDGDRIHAVLHGSAVNQSGRSTGFRAPNVLSEVALMETALADAGLGPADIGMVEAHGTGTSLGDTIEIEAIATALGRKNGGAPLPVGSVKTNMGHLETAAGIASLIKAVLCLRHRAVPPLVHLSSPNPLIDLDGTGITLPRSLQPWHDASGRYAAVSAFGMGGTNAHVIVGPAAEPEQVAAGTPTPRVWGLELSARTPQTVRALAGRLRERLAELPDESYPAFAYCVTHGRARHKWRVRVAAADRAAALEALRALAAGEPTSTATTSAQDQWAAEDDGYAEALPRAVVDLPRYPWARQRYEPAVAQRPAPALAVTAAVPEPEVAASTPSAAPKGSPAGLDRTVTVPDRVAPSGDLAPRLLAVEPGRRRRILLIQHCRELTAEMLGREPADIDPTAPLASLGLNSAATLQLRARLEESLGMTLPATLGWRFPTLEALAPYLAERMGIELEAGAPTGAKPAAERAHSAAPPDETGLDGLSDSQVEALLLAKIDQLDEGHQR